MRRRWIRGAVAAVAGVALLGSAPLPAGGQSEEPTGLTVLASRLTGGAEVDGTGTPGQGDPDGVGLASVVLAPGWSEDVCAQLIVTGIDDVVAAHIHVGDAGTNGPIVVPLPAPVGGASGGCVAAEHDVLEAIADDPAGYYVNVHTAAFPAGAVRGQLGEGPSSLTAGLNGASERTGEGGGFVGDPDGVGEAVVLADPEGLVCVALKVAGIEPPVAGHIHRAGLRANGPVVVPFTDLPVGGSSVECIAVEVALAGEIAADPSSFYVNLHTPSFPPGAIRGQLARGLTSALLIGAGGEVLPQGDAIDAGDATGVPLNAPVVDADATQTGRGYWLAAADGGVFAFGDAAFAGSAGGLALNAPVVGIAATPTADGYWLAAADGGVFAYGDAGFFGSAGALRLNQPVVGIAATPTGRGYWLVGADGGVFAYGDAGFFGSAGSLALNQPVVGIASTPTGLGYTLAAADGGVFSYGDAAFAGSLSGHEDTTVDIDAMPVGPGYRLGVATGPGAGFGGAPTIGLDLTDEEADLDVVATTG